MSKVRRGGLRMIWIEAFLALVDAKTFSAAAKRLNCNQSTVSRDVADLQMWLGHKLFSQYAPCELTSQGEKFEGVALQVVQLLNDSRSSNGMDKTFVAKQPKR